MTAIEVERGNPVVSWLGRARLGPLRGGGLWGSIAVVLAYLAVSIPQWGQAYVIDEAVFPYVADGILKNGAPFFYNGESRPVDVGLWHPPLYDYLLAGHVQLWGTSPFAVRSFGSICVIASFFVLALALRRIAPALRQYGYVVFAALFLLNPLVVSDALVPDIDGTLGLLLIAFALWVCTILAQRPLSPRLVLALFAFATVAVSLKFILAGVAAAMLAGAAVLSPVQRWWKLLWVVLTYAAGAVVSFSLQFALGAALKYDALGPLNYLFGSLGSRAPGRSGLEGTFVNLFLGSGSNAVWIGPAILVSAIAALVIVLVVRPVGVSRSLVGLAVVSSLLVVIGYSYITAAPFGFPKYTSVAVPGLALAVTVLVAVATPLLQGRSARSRSATWLLSAVYALVLAGATAGMFVLMRRHELVNPRSVDELAYFGIGTFAGVVVVTLVFAAALGAFGPSAGSRLRRPLTVAVVGALVFTPVMVQTSSTLVNLTSPFGTRYYYRERGMSEFLSLAGDVIPAGASVIAAKDVGLQLGVPFYEDAALLPLKPAELRRTLEELQVPYLVTRSLYDYSETVFPEQFDVLRELYEPVLERDDLDFTLWKLK